MRTLSVSATSLEREPARLSDLLARGPIVLDGAMGTELDARGVDTRSALWSALALTTAPDVVREVHSDYLDAGARVITTNTYQAALPALIRSGKDAAGAKRVIAAGVLLAKATAWAAQEAIVVAVGINCVAAGVVWMHCTRVGCYWRRVGGTSGRWGLRAVRTTLGQ